MRREEPRSKRTHEGLAEGGEKPCCGYGFWVFGPAASVHSHPELLWCKGHSVEQNLEVLTSTVIFDRNSKVRLHKPRVAEEVTKTSRARSRA